MILSPDRHTIWPWSMSINGRIPSRLIIAILFSRKYKVSLMSLSGHNLNLTPIIFWADKTFIYDFNISIFVIWIKIVDLDLMGSGSYGVWFYLFFLFFNCDTAMLETFGICDVLIFILLEGQLVLDTGDIIVRWTVINIVSSLWEDDSRPSFHVIFDVKVTIGHALSFVKIDYFGILSVIFVWFLWPLSICNDIILHRRFLNNLFPLSLFWRFLHF